MLSESTRLEILEPDVAARVMDGEAIFIHLTSGLYYSTDGIGGEMWMLLEAGRTLGETARWIAAAYGLPEDRAYSDVEDLARRLVEEKLVTASADGSSGAAPPPQAPTHGRTYAPPTIRRYEDMAELFALDPPLPELPEAPPA